MPESSFEGDDKTMKKNLAVAQVSSVSLALYSATSYFAVIVQVREKGQELFNHYMRVGTEEEVNVSARARQDVERYLANNQPIELLMHAFGQCYLETLQMLKGDSWRRFLLDLKARKQQKDPSKNGKARSVKRLLSSMRSSIQIDFSFAKRHKSPSH